MHQPKNILGYRNEYIFFLEEDQIYRINFYNNEGKKWYSTKSGFYSSLLAFGPLNNENGDIIPNETFKKIEGGV